MDASIVDYENRVIIDPDGDLILKVLHSATNGSNELLVSSSTLSRASKVFRSMFGPGSQYREAQPDENGIKHVTLEDYVFRNVEIAMRAIHLNRKGLKSEYEMWELWGLAVFCDKYDMAEAMHWHIGSWTSGVEFWQPAELNSGIRARMPLDPVSYLVVGWVFRKARMFKDATRYFAASTVLNEDQKLVLSPQTAFPEYLPERVTEAIQNKREEVMSSLLDTFPKFFPECKKEWQSKCHSGIRQHLNICDLVGLLGSAVGFGDGGSLEEIWPEKSYPWDIRAAKSYADLLRIRQDYGRECFPDYARRGRDGDHGFSEKSRVWEQTVVPLLANIQGIGLEEFYSDDEIYFPDR